MRRRTPLARIALPIVLTLAVVPRAAAQTSWVNRLAGPGAREALTSPEASVRRDAALRLGRRGEPRQSVRALLDRLASEESPEVRQAIFEALARRGDPVAIEPLAAVLAPEEEGEPGAADGALAVRAIGAIGGERAIRLLVGWLGMAEVGDEAARGLAWIGPSAVPHLLRALADPITAVRAAQTLGAIGDTRATAPLVARLRGALPVARVAMIDALRAIGDERAGPAVARYLDDADPNVARATLRALAVIGGPPQAEAVAALADRGTSEQRAAALATLMVIAPEAAAPRVAPLLDEAGAPAVRRAAIDAMIEDPSPPLVVALAPLLAGEDADAAAEALARIAGGRGLDPLLRAARESATRRFDRALALGYRRHGARLDAARASAIEAHLAGASLGARCLAGRPNSGLREAVGEQLTDPDGARRALAASCALLLGDRALGPSLAARLEEERSPMAFRMLALAALRVGARVDPGLLDARWWDPETAPEALWLAAASLGLATSRSRARALRAMRRGLRAAEPRARAGAALALALAEERTAWRALVAALDDDHDAVRLAAARALAALAVPEAASAIEAAARVEAQDDVRDALFVAARAPGGRPPPAMLPGDDVLFVRISTAPGLAIATQLAVDVLLADGRWLRVPALDGGAVLVPDLPAGQAEVQIRLGRD